MNLQLENAINWDFLVSGHLNSSRYGHLGGAYYRQFLPGGNVLPDIHPAKLIDASLYAMAKRSEQIQGLKKQNIKG